jgi:hypothetical protein
LVAAKLQVPQQLCVVNRSQLSYRFDLYDYYSIDEQVDSVPEIDADSVIEHGQSQLLHDEVAALAKLMNEASLVGALE